MKILYIISGTNLGGATFSFLTLLEKGIEQGNSVVVIIPDRRKEFADILENMKVAYHVVPMTFNSWPPYLGKRRIFEFLKLLLKGRRNQLRLRKAVASIIRLEKPDIVHTNVSPIDIGYFAAKATKVPHIWHIREYCDRDFNIKMFPCKRIFQRHLRRGYSICITKDLQRYNKLTGLSTSFVIYNGVRRENDIFYNEEKAHYFLCASRISPEKDQLRTIRVFSTFVESNPDWRLIILGDGADWYIEQCKHEAELLHIENYVLFAGFTNNVDEYMRNASALLVASPSEGFGRMTAEAVFSGCIVIGFNGAGTKEVLEQTGGFLWNTDNEYLEAMKTVASMTTNKYKELALFAQNKARQLFSIESYVKSVFSLYDSILQ